MDNQEIITLCSDLLENLGIEKYEIIINQTKKTGINLNNDKIDLIKTIYNTNLYITSIQDYRKVKIQINKIDKYNIEQALNNLTKMIEYSEVDTANQIAPFQESKIFTYGDQEPDLDRIYERVNRFLESIKNQFQNIKLETTELDHIKTINWFYNSNKVNLQESRGIYRFKTMFSSKIGNKTSSLNYSYYSTKNLDKDLIYCGSFLDLLKQTNEQNEPQKPTGQFMGPIIVTPDCMIDFISHFINTFLSDYSIITGTSLYKDHLHKPVADSKFSLYSLPVSDEIEEGYFITQDGYEASNNIIIENGILKSYLLSLYGSLKTSKPRSLNDGEAYVVNAGNVPLSNMINSIKKGILLSRFTGDTPKPNGDFCGITKNSYYIEDGKIKYPVEDIFISGNLGDMFNNIIDISTERINFGHTIMPWIMFSGLTICGE